jgi:hypothetical protein
MKIPRVRWLADRTDQLRIWSASVSRVKLADRGSFSRIGLPRVGHGRADLSIGPRRGKSQAEEVQPVKEVQEPADAAGTTPVAGVAGLRRRFLRLYRNPDIRIPATLLNGDNTRFIVRDGPCYSASFSPVRESASLSKLGRIRSAMSLRAAI